MSRTNDEANVGPQPEERARRELDNLMASLQKRLEAMCLEMRETPPVGKERSTPGRGDVSTNLLLLQLLQKQNE